MTRIGDIQLALVIARLFDNSIGGAHERTLKTYVLGMEDEPIHEGREGIDELQVFVIFCFSLS